MADLLIQYHNKETEDHAKLKFARDGDAGLDLYNSGDETTIHPGTTLEIPAGLNLKIPDGYVGLIRNRSSTFAKRGLFVVHNTIDSGYIGPMFVHVWHPGLEGFNRPVIIKKWDRLGQLVIVPYLMPSIKIVDKFPSTERGTKGFGSTGD